MTEKAQAELLEDVLSRYEGSPNPRVREICEAAIKHLHAFVSEVNLTRDEWFEGINFLTRAGQMCDDTRQEFILLSDTFGVSSLVEIINYDAAEGATENTVLGPFFVPGSPHRARGDTMLVDPDEGDRVVIRGTITNDEGKPVAGAELDCWQNATHGFYAVQQPGIRALRTSGASTRPTTTAPTRSEPSVPCPIRSRPMVRQATCSRRTIAAGCAPATPTCGSAPTGTRS